MKRMVQSKKFKSAVMISFTIYIIVLLKLIIFKHHISIMKDIIQNWDISLIDRHIYTANFVPFVTIRNYINAYISNSLNTIIIFENLVGNVIAFIPFGFLLPMIFRKCKLLRFILIISFIFVLGIEIFQLVTYLGEFDVDDIILNVLGAVTGYLIYNCLSTIYNKLFVQCVFTKTKKYDYGNVR